MDNLGTIMLQFAGNPAIFLDGVGFCIQTSDVPSLGLNVSTSILMS